MIENSFVRDSLSHHVLELIRVKKQRNYQTLDQVNKNLVEGLKDKRM